MPYPEFEPGTFGDAAGSPDHNTVWSGILKFGIYMHPCLLDMTHGLRISGSERCYKTLALTVSGYGLRLGRFTLSESSRYSLRVRYTQKFYSIAIKKLFF